MRKIIFLISFILQFNIVFSNQIKNDIEISNMYLSDVVSILSRESGKNIVASQEAKNTIIDAYFESGDDVETILYILADAYNLSLNKTSGATILSLKNEKRENKGRIVANIKNSLTGEAISNVKLELIDSSNFYAFSNKDGILVIDQLPKSIYIAKFSKNGFLSREEILDINKSILSLNIDLVPLNQESNKSLKINSSNFFETNGKLIFTETLSLFNVSTEEIKRILVESFGENLKISSLDKHNKIVITAERDVLEAAKNIVMNLDKNPRQVRITSEILDMI